MQPAKTNLLLRNDTILGVCEAIGQDFGFHPNWLRIILCSLVYFAPAAVIGGYVAAGVVVALIRWVAPDELVAAPALPVAEPRLLEAGFAQDEARSERRLSKEAQEGALPLPTAIRHRREFTPG